MDAVRKSEQTKEEIAERFLVSMSSLNRWLRREHLQADKPGPTTSHTINRAELKELVEREPDCYLDEYAEKLRSNRSTVAYNLKVLRITRKKNHVVRGTNRTSIIAGLHQGQPITPMYFEGYCNTDVVEAWLKEVLLPVLLPGQTVIWDNASFHQSSRLCELIESTGCRLIYLPAYSPDLNPLEQWWSVLKARIRRLCRNLEMTIAQALCHLLKADH